MITVKILCGCGQKYAFDVAPYHGRMPSSIQCPICHADGTPAANEIIARALPPQPIPAAAPPPPQMTPPPPRPLATSAGASGSRIGRSPSASAALKPVGEPELQTAAPARAAAGFAGLVKGGARAALGGVADRDHAADKWKWWYYVLGGLGIIGYQGWLFYENGFYLKYLSGIFGGLCCIGVGLWDFNRKRTGKA